MSYLLDRYVFIISSNTHTHTQKRTWKIAGDGCVYYSPPPFPPHTRRKRREGPQRDRDYRRID